MGISPTTPTTWPSGDPKTLSVVPWQPGYARIVCNGHFNGEPHALRLPRGAEAAARAARRKGWTFNTGTGAGEFSLLKRCAGHRQARALRPERHAAQALLRLQGHVALARLPGAP
jgi:glutamine synthetase